MRLLLDTHIYLWWLANSPRLSRTAAELISSAENVYVSSASFWELSIKASIGKLNIDLETLINQLAVNQFTPLPVGMQHILRLSSLPYLHKDPFDRMLVAQTETEQLRLLTSDRLLAGYSSLVEFV